MNFEGTGVEITELFNSSIIFADDMWFGSHGKGTEKLVAATIVCRI